MNFYKLVFILLFLVFCLSNVNAAYVNIVDENFDDASSPAGWTQGGTADWTFASNFAETQTNNNEGHWYIAINETDLNEWDMNAILRGAPNGTSVFGMSTAIGFTSGSLAGNGYYLMTQDGSNPGLWRADAGVKAEVATRPSTYDDTEGALQINASMRNGNIKVWIAGTEYTATDYTYNDYTYAQFGTNNGNTGSNRIDSILINEVTADPLDANFSRDINKLGTFVAFIDTSDAGDFNITNWTWIIDDVNTSNAQDFNYSTTQLTDINACLQIRDNSGGQSSTTCQKFNTGDWTAPSTTLATLDILGGPITTLTFTCTDNNIGCATTHYNINSEGWLNIANTGTADVNYSGTGNNNILFFSTDANDNNESEQSGDWNKLGFLSIRIIDENTMVTTDAAINFNGTDYNANPTLDLNLFGLDGEFTLTFTKTDYGTRTYVVDLNQFSEVDINFLMLPTAIGQTVSFTMYQPDETTLFTNTFVQLRNHDKNWFTAGRGKTNASGQISFFLNQNDENYSLRNFGTTIVDYNSMILTVLFPKDETTEANIPVNWALSVGGLAAQDYNNLSGNQTISIYANTTGQYQLTVSDVNDLYFSRKYFVNFLGGTSAENFQPWLVPKTGSISSTIKTLSGYTLLPVGGVEIKIYRTLPLTSRTLVEQVVTDGKGEAFVSLEENADYEFEVYVSGTLQFIEDITATSTTIFIRINNVDLETAILNAGTVTIEFLPGRGKLITTDSSLTQTIRSTDFNSDLNVELITFWVTNTDFNGVWANDVDLFFTTIYGTGSTTTNSFDINSTTQLINGIAYDNNGFLILNVMIQTSDGNIFKQMIYDPVRGFDFYRTIAYDIRPIIGCPATSNPNIPCSPLMLIALFLSLTITAGLAFETGLTGLEGLGFVFIAILGIFAYFTWMPPIIYGGMVVSLIVLGIAMAGRQRL